MFVEILPNVFPTIIVEFTVRLGYAVFTMAGLAFIGFGTQPAVRPIGAHDLRGNTVPGRRLVVAVVVPGAGDRLPRRGDQPDRRLDPKTVTGE